MFRKCFPKLSKVLKPDKQSISVRYFSRSQNSHRIDSYSNYALTNHTIFDVKILSLIKHLDEIQYHVTKNFKNTIICLTETWFGVESNATHFKIDVYTFSNRCHVKSHANIRVLVNTCMIVLKLKFLTQSLKTFYCSNVGLFWKNRFLWALFIICHPTLKRNFLWCLINFWKNSLKFLIANT